MLLGHESKEDYFKSIITSQRIGHAYLFFGDAHIGKCAFAKSLANFLENGVFDIPAESLIDTRIFSKSEKGSISIDEMRELKKFLSQYPLKSSKKVAIVDDAERLTEEAQSSLLKIVEEPPASSLIIFIAPSEDILFQPLVSRLSKIYFSRCTSETIERGLRMLYTVEDGVAKEIAARAFGRMGIAVAYALGEKNDVHDSGTVADEIDEYIQVEYEKNKIESSHMLEELIRKETECRRFNLNPSLQRKAVTVIQQKKKHGRNI